jgi:hypothetical protein
MNRPLMSALAPLLRDRTVALPLAMAGTLAALVWIMADPAGGEPMARALLAAGFILWSTDCLRQAHHAVTPERHLADPHRWTFAALQAAMVAAVILIVVGDWITSMSGALIGAALTGLIWLAFPGRPPAPEPHWDTARPMTAEPLRRGLYHLWPALALALLAGLALAPPEDGWTPAYVMFQAAFLPFLLPLYPSKGRFLASAADRLRIGGLILLAAGLWLGAA